MDQTDLEAATKERDNIEGSERPERDDDMDLDPTLPMNQPRVLEKKKVAQLCRVARMIVLEVLQALPNALELKLSNADIPLELLEMGVSEEDTVSGAKEDTLPDESQHTKSDPAALKQVSRPISAHPAWKVAGIAVSNKEFDVQQDSRKPGHPRSRQSQPDYRQRTEVWTVDRIENENTQRKAMRET